MTPITITYIQPASPLLQTRIPPTGSRPQTHLPPMQPLRCKRSTPQQIVPLQHLQPPMGRRPQRRSQHTPAGLRPQQELLPPQPGRQSAGAGTTDARRNTALLAHVSRVCHCLETSPSRNGQDPSKDSQYEPQTVHPPVERLAVRAQIHLRDPLVPRL